VMDFVRGAALSTLWQAAKASARPIDVDIAIAIVLDALAGLHAAHEAIGEGRKRLDVVHRDVSPHNILVGIDGLSRIADFGIAKAAGRVQRTAEGQIKGKLTYMAPEVVRGDEIDRRVDVYAAAIVLWELLTGRKLFSGNEASVLYDVLEAKIDPPSRHREGLPPGLDEVILQALDKDPARRHATAAELSEALERVVGPAPARRVGAWAADLASADLEMRASLIEELEKTSDDTPPLSSGAGDAPARPAPPEAAPEVDRGGKTEPERPVPLPAFPPTDDIDTSVEISRPPRRAVLQRQAEDDPPRSTTPAATTRRWRAIAIGAIGVTVGVVVAVLLLGKSAADRQLPAPGSSADVAPSSPERAASTQRVPSAPPGTTESAAPVAPSASSAPSVPPPSTSAAPSSPRPGPPPGVRRTPPAAPPSPPLPTPEPPVL